MSIDVASKLAKIDLKTMAIFIKVYQTRSATETARLLNITQSSVSRSISALRQAVDDDLFYRRKHGLVPTSAADLYYGHFLKAIQHVCLTAEKNFASDMSANIVVHASAMFLPIIAKKVVESAELFGIDPKAFVFGIKTDESFNLLCNGEIDAVLSLEEHHRSGISNTKVGSEKSLYISAAESHPIWNADETKSLKSMVRHKFMYLSSFGFNDRIDPLESYCRSNSIEMNEVLSVDTIGELVSNLITGRYACFMCSSEVTRFVSQMNGLRVDKLSDSMMNSLHSSLMRPNFYVTHREYGKDDINYKHLEAFKAIASDMVSE